MRAGRRRSVPGPRCRGRTRPRWRRHSRPRPTAAPRPQQKGATLSTLAASAARAAFSPAAMVCTGISCCIKTTSPRAGPALATSPGSTEAFAPAITAMTFSPSACTRISAVPVLAWVSATLVRSTPPASSRARASLANASLPTAPISRVAPPARAAAKAWLAPLPPGAVLKRSPGTVSPGRGRRATVAIRSRLTEPMTMIKSLPPEVRSG